MLQSQTQQPKERDAFTPLTTEAQSATKPTEPFQKHKRLTSYSIDPFAIQISLPPLILLSYVTWKYFMREDPRELSIREAEQRHNLYLQGRYQEEELLKSLPASHS
jgi:hypothetical protein